ncbi:hypothetical protein GCM10022254_41290 [Actinomadura meridiana]|uniref:Uncharacterized protein n=1 Tax=Actinomadura meridiana TaxID=559626 RepID=A0ABP8C7K2_9ACTN
MRTFAPTYEPSSARPSARRDVTCDYRSQAASSAAERGIANDIGGSEAMVSGPKADDSSDDNGPKHRAPATASGHPLLLKGKVGGLTPSLSTFTPLAS